MIADEDEPPTAGEDAATANEAESEPARGVLEVAANGRAKCRACSKSLAKGEWRLGERAKNPFGEGDTTYWFHAACGAVRRPEVFIAALPEGEVEPAIAGLVATAQFGQENRRAGRFAAVGVAPSGRARCRHCRELIEKGEVRIELSIFKDGRFDPMGYLHPRCLTEYVGVQVPFERLEPLCDGLPEEQRRALREVCG
jgi:hypothetical protein